MSRENLITLIISVPIGIISGLYSGLIVARYQRFSDLRSQVLRIIREIDFINENSRIDFPKRKEVPELVLIASDFFFLRHVQAGESTLRLQKEISETLYLASKGKVDYVTFDKQYALWQERGRRLKPNPIWLLRFWAGQ